MAVRVRLRGVPGAMIGAIGESGNSLLAAIEDEIMVLDAGDGAPCVIQARGKSAFAMAVMETFAEAPLAAVAST